MALVNCYRVLCVVSKFDTHSGLLLSILLQRTFTVWIYHGASVRPRIFLVASSALILYNKNLNKPNAGLLKNQLNVN